MGKRGGRAVAEKGEPPGKTRRASLCLGPRRASRMVTCRASSTVREARSGRCSSRSPPVITPLPHGPSTRGGVSLRGRQEDAPSSPWPSVIGRMSLPEALPEAQETSPFSLDSPRVEGELRIDLRHDPSLSGGGPRRT